MKNHIKIARFLALTTIFVIFNGIHAAYGDVGHIKEIDNQTSLTLTVGRTADKVEIPPNSTKTNLDVNSMYVPWCSAGRFEIRGGNTEKAPGGNVVTEYAIYIDICEQDENFIESPTSKPSYQYWTYNVGFGSRRLSDQGGKGLPVILAGDTDKVKNKDFKLIIKGSLSGLTLEFVTLN